MFLPSDQEAHVKEVRKTTKYATQALRSWQVLEEINDFNNLNPESEDDNGSISDIDDEDSTFTFASIPLNNKAHNHSSALTPWSHHVPPMVLVQGMCPLNLAASLPPGVLDPALAVPVAHVMPAIPLSGGPADPPQGTRYNAWTGVYDSISDISSQEIT
ncbi:hypothetical protein BDR07DRAFT_1483093 [Suillus spraguei]|nr:hypothetical protein BDR07DRAFT_1483093 [Suillus spraguei]